MFQDYKELDKRNSAGVGSYTFVKEPAKDYYSLFLTGATQPSVYGSFDSVEFDSTTSSARGKVPTKRTLDAKDYEFYLTRDNIYRLEQLKGKTLDFLQVTSSGIGFHYVATIDYRPNDLSATEVETGTVTITPSIADEEPILDCRDLLRKTLIFTETVPENVVVTTEDSVLPIVSQEPDFKIEAESDNSAITVTAVSPTSGAMKGSVTIKRASGVTGKVYATVYITILKDGFAPWTTTVTVESEQ